ncbi:MAG TPA: WD40 repeat domain-containing protein [Polyangiaceae bacterium]|jgi:hypothetical protein|nr:WD40 repeat domain-containing protein [Polyangiaceae bacterium]
MATEPFRGAVRYTLILALPVLLSSLLGCGSSADAEADLPGFQGGPSSSGGTSASTSPGGIDVTVGGAASLPPEKELDQTFQAPVATGGVLWTANPVSGRVALIDAQTLQVRMTNAGFGPTYLAAVPSAVGTESAIVLNVGSHDASWLQATPDQITVTTIATSTGANSWSISDDGHFAIAWTDVTQIQGPAPDPTDGFSELTVIDLSATPPVSTRLSVGFRPSKVAFDAQKLHAFAVVDEGISVLDLSGSPLVSALISVTTTGNGARDVNISPDGSFAVVRVDGSSDVQILDLTSSASVPQIVSLESDVTDLDLSADGKTATAVLGDETPPTVVSFPVPNPGTDPTSFVTQAIPGELVRSVTLAPDNQVALLYANAVPSDDLTLLDTEDFTYRTVDLKGAVQQVYVSPDSQAAITFQVPPPGSVKKGMFSVVPTESVRPPQIVDTDAVPQDVAFSSAAVGKALLTVHDATSTTYGVYVIGLTNLEQNLVPLASAPLPGAAGIVPDVRVGFVAQQHPEGRITFINLDSGVAQTLTGFEIAAGVVQ